MAIKAERLSYRLRGKTILKDINLEFREGEFVLITGPSGAGKTTLVYCLSSIIPKLKRRGEREGKVLIKGVEAKKADVLGEEIGVVLQNPELQIFGLTVEEDVAFGLENKGMRRDKMRERVRRKLNLVGLEEERMKKPRELSGGEKRRLAIASTLALEPEIIFLDEPFSSLDFESRRILTSILKKFKGEKTVVLVERRLGRVLDLADKVVGIKGGKKVAEVEPSQLSEDLAKELGASLKNFDHRNVFSEA